MESTRKLSIRRVEISLNNFNDIAIPHHVDLLKKHKANITKFQGTGDLERIRNEQINATRIIIQLKHLLEEMEVLRQQVLEKDIQKFDKMTEKSRKITMRAIQEYIDMPNCSENTLSPSISSGYSSTAPSLSQDQDSEHRKTHTTQFGSQQSLKLQSDSDFVTQEQLAQKESYLRSYEALQDEVQELHELFVKFQELIETQKEHVDVVEDNVETTAVNVEQGTNILAKTERHRVVWYPIAGAVIGCCVAGPVGLIAGLKVGGLALLSGSALGFTGGRYLKKKKEESYDTSTTTVPTLVKTACDKKED